MQGIFISYRREDSAGHSGRIFDHLIKHFGKDNVFMDISAIEPGVDFVESIDRAVGSCAVLLVIMGKDWLELKDASGRRRIDNPDDHLHVEIATALKRNIRVIPVLVQGAVMPVASDLPGDLALLSRRQAHELSDQRWDFDTDELIKILEKIVGQPVSPKRPVEIKQPEISALPAEKPAPVPPIQQPVKKGWSTKKKMIIGGIVVLLGIAGYIYDYYDTHRSYDNYYVPPQDYQPPAPQPEYVPPQQITLTGVWSGSDGIMYEIQQNANAVTLLGRDVNQTPVIQGQGFVQGQQVTIHYRGIDNTGGIATFYISQDGTVLQGNYVNQVTGLSGPIVLSR